MCEIRQIDRTIEQIILRNNINDAESKDPDQRFNGTEALLLNRRYGIGGWAVDEGSGRIIYLKMMDDIPRKAGFGCVTQLILDYFKS